jgi:regulator of sigma E protease
MIILTIIGFILILLTTIMIHEMGHFLAAKLLGIRVETFSIGFGKRLFSKRLGTTNYQLSLIPFGGYIKLAGDKTNKLIEGESYEQTPDNDRYDLRPAWQKCLILIAGPLINLLLALSIPFVGALMKGVPVNPQLTIKYIVTDGAADLAGLKIGDKIIAFNGIEHPSWKRIYTDSLISPGHVIPIHIERNGQNIKSYITPSSLRDGVQPVGLLGMQPDYGDHPVIISSVHDNSPAQEAGLQRGDRFVKVDNEIVYCPQQIHEHLLSNPDRPIRFTIERNGSYFELTATPRSQPDGTKRIGYSYDREEWLEKAGVADALQHSINTNIDIIRLSYETINQFFNGNRAIEHTLSGPISMARTSSTAMLQEGIIGAILIFGFFNLSVFLFNLIPIPSLDGGAILILFIETGFRLIGIKVPEGLQLRLNQVGILTILLTMYVVIAHELFIELKRWLMI